MRKLCCQICGGDIVFDSATKGGVCSQCGLSYSHQDLKSFGSQDQASVAPSAALAFPPPVTEPVYVSGSMMPSSHEAKAPPVVAASGEDARIGWWHTNVGASIGGALAICAINALPFLGDLAPWLGIVDYLLALALVTGTLVYALYAYPSYFGPKPKLTSAAKVSFLNCFFGGPLFGCLWNRCLTRGKKGISYIVVSVLAGVGMILGVLMLSFELNTSPEERMFDRIQEPGEMVDESTWVSDPMYPELIGDDPTILFSYWEVFNDEACWVLSEVTGKPYDEVHLLGDAIYRSKEEITLDGNDAGGAWVQSGYAMQAANDSWYAPLWQCPTYSEEAYRLRQRLRPPQYCERPSSHVMVYDSEFQVDGIRGTMLIVQLFAHEAGERYAGNHKGTQTPWYVVVSIEDRI